MPTGQSSNINRRSSRLFQFQDELKDSWNEMSSSVDLKGQRYQMSDHRMSGSALYNANHELVAKAKGESLLDNANRRVGFVRGDTLFDLEDRKMMSVRGSEIYDASGKRVASLSVVKKRIQGAAEEMIFIALWYCFIR